MRGSGSAIPPTTASRGPWPSFSHWASNSRSMCLLLLAPKYRNSSADLLFQKSQLLFGLDQAAAAIHSTGEALLVEGPLM